MNCELNTKVIQQKPQALTVRIMQQWLKRYGWLMLIAMGFCGGMAVQRWEWIVVGVALLLLVYPLILAFIYFNYGTKPEYLRFVRPMTICFGNNGITIQEEDQTPETIPFDNIKNISVYGKETVVALKVPRYLSLVIKDDQWDTDIDIKELKKTLSAYFTENGIKFA